MSAQEQKKFTGIVQKGARRGSELGFPTINIPLTDANVSGIYVARAKVGEEEYDAVAFADPHRGVLEAHLLDFAADLYNWNVRITLIKKLRESKRFDSVVELQQAIAQDIRETRAFFERLR